VLISEFADLVLGHVGSPAGRPSVLAVDGRSASGKTTLATRLADAVPGTTVVHTDDIAWHHSVFDWVDLMVDGVLEPVRRGEAVSYRPPKWDERGRPGAVEVPAGQRLVVVEGVGAGRRELTDHLDGVVWVETPREARDRRDDERMAAGEVTREIYESWMAEEVPFVADQRAWERAFAIVDGTSPDAVIVRSRE
jgi:energy-coupling factor transporter ATP-binding protein EcfA2